jgi:hypothetical protein
MVQLSEALHPTITALSVRQANTRRALASKIAPYALQEQQHLAALQWITVLLLVAMFVSRGMAALAILLRTTIVRYALWVNSEAVWVLRLAQCVQMGFTSLQPGKHRVLRVVQARRPMAAPMQAITMPLQIVSGALKATTQRLRQVLRQIALLTHATSARQLLLHSEVLVPRVVTRADQDMAASLQA